MHEFSARLEQLLDGESLSVTAFSQALGYDKPEKVYRLFRSDEAKPSYDMLLDITNKFVNWNMEWLISGKGDKYKTTLPGKKSKVEVPSLHLPPVEIDKDLVKMPVLELQFAAGASAITPEYLETAHVVFLPKTWLKRGKTYACGRVKGNSMAPTLLDSGYVIIRLLDKGEWDGMANEEVFVVVSKDGNLANAQIKRVKNRFKQRNFIVLMSDNPDKASFPNYNLITEEIVSIWHVDLYLTGKLPNIHNQYYSRLQAMEDRFDELIQELKPVLKLK